MNGSEITKEAVEQTQIRSQLERLHKLCNEVLDTQASLKERLRFVSRDDVLAKPEEDKDPTTFVPMAAIINNMCQMAEHAVSENSSMIQLLEI